jgi:peptidoglycan hydrolase-like protein with peptidoglycan-binding domain
MADEPALSRGDTGEWVSYLQQLLEYLRHGSGFVAGTFDEATEAAVRAAQQLYGVLANGVADSATWAALVAASQGGAAATGSAEGDGPPADIAVSIQDEVAAPTDEISLDDLEPLPSNVVG